MKDIKEFLVKSIKKVQTRIRLNRILDKITESGGSVAKFKMLTHLDKICRDPTKLNTQAKLIALFLERQYDKFLRDIYPTERWSNYNKVVVPETKKQMLINLTTVISQFVIDNEIELYYRDFIFDRLSGIIAKSEFMDFEQMTEIASSVTGDMYDIYNDIKALNSLPSHRVLSQEEVYPIVLSLLCLERRMTSVILRRFDDKFTLR